MAGLSEEGPEKVDTEEVNDVFVSLKKASIYYACI